MNNVKYISIGVLLISSAFMSSSAFTSDSPLKTNFLLACDSSPHIDESSDCTCIFNEVIHQFGDEDAAELIPIISGNETIEKSISDSISFISGQCEE